MFSRIEASKLTLMLQPLDIRKLAEDMVVDMLRKSEEGGEIDDYGSS